jgi:oligosaccharide repeat unit polymerase
MSGSKMTTSRVTLSVWDSTILLSGLGCVLGGLLTVTFLRPELDTYFLCFAGLTAIIAMPLVIGCVTRRMDPFDPTTIIAASYFLYFVYAPMRGLLAGEYYFFGRLVMPTFPLASAYLACGVAAMWAGYFASGIARRGAAVLPEPPGSRRGVIAFASVVALLALVAVTTYAHGAGLSWTRLLTLGQLGSTTTTSQTGVPDSENVFRNYLYGTLDWLTSAWMLFYAFSRRGRKWLVVAFIALLLVYTTIGFRFRILILVLAPIVYHYLRVKRRPGALKVFAAAFAVILLIGAIGLTRTAFRSSSSVDIGAVSVGSSSESFEGDLSIYQPFLAIIQSFPREHDYLWGSSYAYLLVQPIPRSLWSDKPEAPIRAVVQATLGSDAATSGVAYPNVGEFYANFGAVGLIAGMWVFGLLARISYEYLSRHENNDWARVLYAVIFPFLVQVISRGYFVQIFQEASFLFVPLFLGMWVCRHSSYGNQSDMERGSSILKAMERGL